MSNSGFYGDSPLALPGHELRVSLGPFILDPSDTLDAVGIADPAYNPGEQVIQLPAVGGIPELRTVPARMKIPVPAAALHLAEEGLASGMTSGTFTVDVGLAGSAVHTACGDKPRVHDNCTHDRDSLYMG